MPTLGRTAASIGANFIPGIGPIASAAIQAGINRRPGDGILGTTLGAAGGALASKGIDSLINNAGRNATTFAPQRQSPLDPGFFSRATDVDNTFFQPINPIGFFGGNQPQNPLLSQMSFLQGRRF